MADTTPPTITLTANKTTLKAGETALITFTLSEVATDFVLSDIAVSGGTLSNFSGSGKTYSATFTPLENSTVAGLVSVGNYKFSDASGNANEDGNDADNRLALSIDTGIPTISITSSKSIFGVGETALISFKLSEPSINFTLSDVSVYGGVLTNFNGSGVNYTATFTPKAGVSTSGSITVGFDAFSDSSGNLNNQSIAFGVYLNTNSDPQIPRLNWAKLFGGNSSDSLRAITTGLDGSIYVAGYTYTSLDGQTHSGGGDVLINKFNADGSKAWTRLLGTGTFDNAYSIATGLDGSIYVSGFTYGLLDGQVNVGSSDAFVAKYNPYGTKVWTKQLGSSSSDGSNALAVGADGAIYVGGFTNGSIDGQSNSGANDAFVTKFNPDGSKVWTRLLGSSGVDAVNSIATGLDGSIYVGGVTAASLDGQTSAGESDAFVTKYNPDGTRVWTRLIGSSSYDTANALTVGVDGAIYVGGNTNGGVFDGIQSSSSGFISKFLPDGTRVWTKLNLYSQINALKIGQDGAIFAGGNYTSGVYVGGDGEVAPGGGDAFVARYETDGTKSWTRILGSASMDNLYGLAVGVDGSLFLAGNTYSDLYGEKSLGMPFIYFDKGLSGSSTPDAFLMNLSVPDNVPPKISISRPGTSSVGMLKGGDSVVLNFEITEAVKDFVATDITVKGGTLTSFQGADKNYTATFTVGFEGAVLSVLVGNGKFSDSSGNFNLDGLDTNNTITLAVVDNQSPTIAVSSNKSGLQGEDSATLTFTLSEASINFAASDITVTGGTLSNFAGSGIFYTATFTLGLNSTLNGTISVASGSFTDAAGNKNADGSDSNNSLNFSRLPTIINETHVLSVIVDKNVLGTSATLLKELKESITFTNGAITKHLVEYAGLTFEYSQIDSLITTVTRDGEFTAEFTKEINDYLGAEQNITYSAAVAIVGAASIDGIILSVAGADGNFVG